MKQRKNYGQSVNTELDSFEEMIEDMKEMSNLRLIQKLSRPISMSNKVTLLTQYKRHFLNLHAKLEMKKNEAKDNKFFSKLISGEQVKNLVPEIKDNIRQSIKKVENKYKEVFVDGSFKHYQKVAGVYRLPNNLQIIRIEEWSKELQNSLFLEKPWKCCC